MTTEPQGADSLATNPLDTVWPPGQVILMRDFTPDHPASWLIIPALGRLKRAQHWMTWICPPYKPTVDFLRANGIDPKHLRIIHRRTRRDRLLAAERALASRTNDIVLVWIEDITAHDHERLNQAAARARTRGMLIGTCLDASARGKSALRGHTTQPEPDRGNQSAQLGLHLD